MKFTFLTNTTFRSFLVAVALFFIAGRVAAQTDEMETPQSGAADAVSEKALSVDEAAAAAVDETSSAAGETESSSVEPIASAKPNVNISVTEPVAVKRDAEMSKAEGEEKKNESEIFDMADYVGYDGGFYLNDKKGVYSIKMNARLQAKYALEALDTGDDDKAWESNFSVPAARIKFKGHVISKSVSYALQLDFGKGNALLKDFYADFAFVKNVFHLRVGQWVKPFSRQQITSSGKLEFTGRAMTDKAFGAGRDIGLAFHNNYEKSPGFEWAIGLFNGTGEKPWFEGNAELDAASDDYGDVSGKFTNVPDAFNPMLIARAGFNVGELKGYSEADLEGGAPRLGVGVSGVFDFDADNNDDGAVRAALDYIFKAYGFSSTGGLYVGSIQNGDAFGDQTYEAMGMHTQLGYAIRGKVQPVFRYGVINPDGGRNYMQEITGGLSIYFAKHDLKWQTEAGVHLEKDGADEMADTIVATQLQLAF